MMLNHLIRHECISSALHLTALLIPGVQSQY